MKHLLPMFGNTNIALENYNSIMLDYFQILKQGKTMCKHYSCMVGMVHPECLHKDFRASIIILIAQIYDFRAGKLIPIA